MLTALTIAGFDPSSGAGVTADLMVFASHGLAGVSAITALTVQSTVGVRSVHPVAGQLLGETLHEIDADLPVSGIKIGMLGTADCVAEVARFIEAIQRTRRPMIVLDPVLRSSSGSPLLDGPGTELLRKCLLPLVDWATPNLDELAILGGWHEELGRAPDEDQIVAKARTFQDDYPGLGLVVTGGHMEEPSDLHLSRADGSSEERGPYWIRGERVQTSATHGTGCAFSSAFLCSLMLGKDSLVAAKAAKRFVVEAMRRAVPRGSGCGPMNLLWPLTEQTS